jgi:fructosamine-3-kinase
LYPVEGGSINTAYRILTKDNEQWFCKINENSPFPDLLEKEKMGLDLLRKQDIIRIPAVVANATAGGTQILVLEWIAHGPKTAGFWRLFGEQLARLHRVAAPSFGLPENNYMGALPQYNSHSPYNTCSPGSSSSPGNPSSADHSSSQSRSPFGRWTDFFIQLRLEPQTRLAASNGLLEPAALRQFERLYTALPGIFPEEVPSLLHGDLWSGNFICDEHSRPVLIDPAVYFGHRSMDLAMTTLFGGFDRAFYEAYAYHFPFPPNYREQWSICNLYPLLIHLNLFGKSYLEDILHTIQRF